MENKEEEKQEFFNKKLKKYFWFSIILNIVVIYIIGTSTMDWEDSGNEGRQARTLFIFFAMFESLLLNLFGLPLLFVDYNTKKMERILYFFPLPTFFSSILIYFSRPPHNSNETIVFFYVPIVFLTILFSLFLLSERLIKNLQNENS
jgi:hypothetical protein